LELSVITVNIPTARSLMHAALSQISVKLNWLFQKYEIKNVEDSGKANNIK
jgi:hypothetical protein